MLFTPLLWENIRVPTTFIFLFPKAAVASSLPKEQRLKQRGYI